MNNDQLSTGASSAGSQTETQSPQTSTNNIASGTPAGNVQPGTATDLLNSKSGLLLSPTTVTTVNLSPVTTNASTKAAAESKPKSHHTDAALVGICAGLFVLAIVLFIIINRSAKNTTKAR